MLFSFKFCAPFEDDYLICDNASTHKASAMFPALEAILRQYGITLIFLPKYSPELNPCELVWATVKNSMWARRDPTGDFLRQAIRFFSRITRDNMIAFYRHCIYHFDA
jgi:transposase